MERKNEAKCTFGTRMYVDPVMLTEVTNREIRHFRAYKTYRANFASTPLTTKFYAMHDQVKTVSEEEELKVKDYADKVSQSRAAGPKTKYAEAITDSHNYGWYTTPILAVDRNDIRFYRPLRESSETKHEIKVRSCMVKPKSKKPATAVTAAPPAPVAPS